jgi:hypothetical protein
MASDNSIFTKIGETVIKNTIESAIKEVANKKISEYLTIMILL